MPVVKGGVWTNIEDEILKASVSKYGLNQWARVSSLLARKTPKQCKARWNEWLDPSIKKIEWSKEEDEKLLHLAKLMPTQWRTIAPVPARPDTIDLDEDEKEMLSEARARLANTQGKKAKRKARERQQEESRRLASLQKRRELKTAGINIKVVTRKKGQMDYNADIPFEKKAHLANKRKGDGDDDGDSKRRKKDKDGASASHQAAMKAGQQQKIREAEQSSKRLALNLPAPQVSDGELEDIVKMGMMGERASNLARQAENDATRGLVSEYSTLNNGTPIRTPRAPAQEDHIANELRNIRALTNTQSSLLGGENTPLHEGTQSTGFDGIAPRKHVVSTPNPLATPLRAGANGVGATPGRPGQTPMRTPRDSFALNEDGTSQVGATPRDVKMRELAVRNQLKQGLASLPKPKDVEWELELPEEQQEVVKTDDELREDASRRDRRDRETREALEALEQRRRSQVMQKDLPRPVSINISALVSLASKIGDGPEGLIAAEAAKLIANDATKFPQPGGKVKGSAPPLDVIGDSDLAAARQAIAAETAEIPGLEQVQQHFESRSSSSLLLGLGCYDDDEERHQETVMRAAFDVGRPEKQQEMEDVMANMLQTVQDSIIASADRGTKLETKLKLHLGGYLKRQALLREKMNGAHEALEKANNALHGFKTLAISEEVAIARRLEALREEVGFVSRREREAQEMYRRTKDELDTLRGDGANGVH
ncbi:hypothetical protein VdG1_05925 [Verticillium dahliae VDG1]|nr:hypothetical protein VdG1_05925 [Verticillium dahliae VDG1]